MQVIVIGGSNCITQTGFVARMKARAGGLNVVNRAVGSACSMMGYYRLASLARIAPGDVVIWDYALNDENEMAVNPSVHVGLVLAYAELTLRRTLLARARFVPVILRPRALASLAVYSLYRMGLRDLFDRYGILAVDGHALYAEAHEGADVPPSDYADGLHYAPDSAVTDLVAKAVLARLQDTAPAPQALHPPCLCPPDADVRVVTNFRNLTCEPYKNSLVSENLWRPLALDTMIFQPEHRAWNLAAVVALGLPTSGHSLALRSGTKTTVIPLTHRHATFQKSLLKMQVLQPVQYLPVSSELPLWLVGAAPEGQVTPKRPAMPPPGAGLVGLVLERPRR
jgi:hypothetical protein